MSAQIHVTLRPAMHQVGFTLIELVVAMSIFAVLSLAGWQVFNNLMTTRERASVQAERLSAEQLAYGQMLRDLTQAVARPVRDQSGTQPALLLSAEQLSLTRIGYFDPRFRQVSPLERVEYRLEDQQLLRLSNAAVDQSGVAQPTRTVLLRDVQQIRFEALNPDAQSLWPSVSDQPTASPDEGVVPAGDTRLPRGVQVTFTQQGRERVWVFALVETLPAMEEEAASQPNVSGQNGAGVAP
jgi:general secretion pathway protein J